MLRAVFQFEFAYQVRRPWPWLFVAVLLVVNFLMTRDSALSAMMYENFYINSPFAIAKTTVMGTIIWMLLAAPVAGEAGARDVATRMYPLIYTARATRMHYLGGRFLAAFLVNALILALGHLGIVIGVYAPGVAGQIVGPPRPDGYINTYAFIALPTAFVATALQFWFAVRSGRAMASYAGSMLLIFSGFFVAALLMFSYSFGALLDPVGIRYVIEDIARMWTPIERNTRAIRLEGIILQNRLIWTAVGASALAICYWTFQFAHRAEGTRRGVLPWRRAKGPEAQAMAAEAIKARSNLPAAIAAARVRAQPSVGAAAELRQTLEIALESFRVIAKSWGGRVLLVAIPLMMIPVLVDQMEAAGAKLMPTTPQVLREMTASLSNELSRWVIIPLITIFFAGELVWREREAGMGEFNDAMPGSEWPRFGGKFLGLSAVLALFLVNLMLSGMVAQVAMEYRDFEIGLYLKVLLGLQLPEYVLFALLALVIHVVVDEKYIGHLVAVMAYVFIAALAGMLGIEHPLLVYGASPGWTYTPLTGFGSHMTAWIWFKLYWAAWALLLAVVGRLLWSRGKERGYRFRMQWAARRFTRPTASVAALAIALIVSLGGFNFYNTNVLNRYRTAGEEVAQRAEYERRYGKYEHSAQPEMTATKLNVEIYPARRALDVTGTYRLRNNTSVSIDTVHVAIALGNVTTKAITFDRSATLAVDDAELGYRIYTLAEPLKPGDSLQLNFEVHTEPRGFIAGGIDGAVTAKGTAFKNGWLPAIGYQQSRALTNANDRQEQGLEARPLIASLYDAEGREPPVRGGGIAFEAIVGTDENQVGVAPGALRKTWNERGRRYFQYVTDAPIGSEWAFFSADYSVHEAEWKPAESASKTVAIRIYHARDHTAHIDRLLRSARASLDYYSSQFGAYPYGHLTFVEHPGAPGHGLHAEASMVSHGEGFSFWIPKEEQGLDFPYAVIAHEMGHQWTLPYAFVEGAPFMSEGLAWYSAMQVVKSSRGEAEFRSLMSTMRQPEPYPPIRRGEPLLRALDPYLSYRRGPFAMYALSEYAGAAAVNGAIRRLVAQSELPGARRVTTLDLYRELGASVPDSLKPLLHDLFEVNAYWLLHTGRATAKKTADGKWQVTMDINVRKMMYDSAGVETELPMDEWVEVGVFGTPVSGGDEQSRPLYLQKHRIHTGAQSITVTVGDVPDQAGVDPRRLLIEGPKESGNKLVKVGM